MRNSISDFCYNKNKKVYEMQTIKLEIEDSKVDIVLNIIENLKSNVISKYEIINQNSEQKDFTKISNQSFSKVWDNKEDSIYDKFL